MLKQFWCFCNSWGGGSQLNWVVESFQDSFQVIKQESFQQTEELELVQNKSLLLEDKMFGKYEKNPLS